jgi:enoyl reductase-like protein
MKNRTQPIHTINESLNESNADYQNTSEDDVHQLKEALQRTDMEKFLYLMKLIKAQRMMQKMKITHKD